MAKYKHITAVAVCLLSGLLSSHCGEPQCGAPCDYARSHSVVLTLGLGSYKWVPTSTPLDLGIAKVITRLTCEDGQNAVTAVDTPDTWTTSSGSSVVLEHEGVLKCEVTGEFYGADGTLILQAAGVPVTARPSTVTSVMWGYSWGMGEDFLGPTMPHVWREFDGSSVKEGLAFWVGAELNGPEEACLEPSYLDVTGGVGVPCDAMAESFQGLLRESGIGVSLDPEPYYMEDRNQCSQKFFLDWPGAALRAFVLIRQVNEAAHEGSVSWGAGCPSQGIPY